MEFNEEKLEDTNEQYVELYSKKAIIGFSAIFNVMFGGALLVINMWVAGYKKDAYQVIVFSVLYHFLSLFLVGMSGITVNPEVLNRASSGKQITPTEMIPFFSVFALTLVINLIGGLILTRLFYKRCFPEDDYYPKPILQAIMVALLVSLVFGFILKSVVHF